MDRTARNQSQQSQTACFKCKSIFASLTALEIHLRSCDIDWEPPRPGPWTFIPPPDSLGGLGNGRGRGRGPGRGQSDSRGTGGDSRGRGDNRGRGRGRDRGGGSGDDERRREVNTTGRGRGRGRGAGSQSRQATDGDPSIPSSPRGQRGAYQNARGQGQRQRGGRRSSTASNSNSGETSSPRNLASVDQGAEKSAKPAGPTCSKCQLSFANSQELVKHFNDSPAHPNSGFSPPSEPSSSKTSTLPALPRHWPTSGPSPCTKCNIVFDSPVELAGHFRNSKDHPDSLPITGYQYGVPVFTRPESPDGTKWSMSDEYLRLRREMQLLDDYEEDQPRTRRRRGDDWIEDLDNEEARLVLELRQLGLW